MIGDSFKPVGRPIESHPWSSGMIPRLEEARLVGGFTIHLRFSDGTEGDVDLAGELYGEVFDPLKDPALFRRFYVHPEFHTLSWPNGADLAPEFLYEKAQIPA